MKGVLNRFAEPGLALAIFPDDNLIVMGEQLCHYLCRHICFRDFMICVTSLQYEEEHCAAWAELGGFVVEDLGRQGMRAPGQLRRPEQLFTLNLRYFTELHSGREDHRVAPPSGFPRERAGPRVTFGGPWWTLGSSWGLSLDLWANGIAKSQSVCFTPKQKKIML